MKEFWILVLALAHGVRSSSALSPRISAQRKFSILDLGWTDDDHSINDDEKTSKQQQHESSCTQGYEQYARALNMNVQQVSQTKQAHLNASQRLQDHLLSSSNELSGREKHQLLCQHRFQYGRHPFVCRNCWSYKQVCICNHRLVRGTMPPKGSTTTTKQPPQPLREQQLPRRSMPFTNLEVVVWMHHREWGLTSNTGCILPLMLEQCHVWMKGLSEHDTQLEDCLMDDSCLVVVLWPSSSSSSSDTKKEKIVGIRSSEEDLSIAMSVEDLLQHLHLRQQQRVVLLAVDGTWRNARRMVGRLPSTVPRIDLSMGTVHPSMEVAGKGSILAPLRTRGTNSGNGNIKDETEKDRHVCTAQAVVGALAALGLPQTDVEDILSITKIKVDLIQRYRQGKVP